MLRIVNFIWKIKATEEIKRNKRAHSIEKMKEVLDLKRKKRNQTKAPQGNKPIFAFG